MARRSTKVSLSIGPVVAGLLFASNGCDGEEESPRLEDFTVYPRNLALHDRVQEVECTCYLDEVYQGGRYHDTVDECVADSRPIPESELPCAWRAYEEVPAATEYLDCIEPLVEAYVSCAESMPCEPGGVAAACYPVYYGALEEMCPFPEALRERLGECSEQV